MDCLTLQPLWEDDVPNAEGAYAEGWSLARIEIRAGGRHYAGAQDYRDRLTDDQVRAKLRENVEGMLAAADANAVEKLCGDPMALISAREIAMTLHVEV